MEGVVGEHYELRQRVGRGGMSTVYAARDLHTDRQVAVKLLHEQFADDARFVVLFRQEALAAERISHPNVARVLDYGHWRGTYYLVEEYVDGPSLAKILAERGHLEPPAALAIGAAVAAALGAAHQSGLVHRDVKPANILIGADGIVRVTDFGIARAVAQTGLTMTTMALGTAYYAPPEQIQGQPATPASDVYSLGAVLFEMLAGRRPFEGTNPLHVAMQHVNEDPPDLGTYRADLSESTRRAIQRMLQKAPAERYVDGGAAFRAIASLPEYVPGLIFRPSSATVAGVARRRSKLINTTLGLLALALIVGSGIVLMGAAANYVREHPALLPFTLSTATPTPQAPTAAIPVPSVVGRRLSDATDRLTGAGLSVGSVTYEESSEADRGRVIDQSPGEGRVVMPGERINLVLGIGPELPSPTRPAAASPTASARPTTAISPTATPRPTTAASPTSTPERRQSPTSVPSPTPTTPPPPAATSTPAPASPSSAPTDAAPPAQSTASPVQPTAVPPDGTAQSVPDG